VTRIAEIFNIYCPLCETDVSAATMLGDAELDRALQNDEDIYAIHMADSDHKWRLNQEQEATQ